MVQSTFSPPSASVNIFAVIPAAGVGRRMGSVIPKQYIKLAGATVFEHCLKKLLAVTALQKIVVAVSADDRFWKDLPVVADSRIMIVEGGEERCQSVMKGLQALAPYCQAQDWVLVHDVARPCVAVSDIENQIKVLIAHPVGGILAVPVTDTIKQVDGKVITDTVDRSSLWQAQTPQMFRYQLLLEALQGACERRLTMTDEASALELAGYQPAVVEALKPNLKITRTDDLALAEYFLQQEQTCE